MNAYEYIEAMLEMTDAIEDTDENMDRVSLTILSAAMQKDWEYYIDDGVVMLYC